MDKLTLEDYVNRQKRIYKNKEKHNFNLTDKHQEVRYIIEEVAELMHAIEKDDMANMKEELADIVIFSYGLAEIAGLGNLDEEIFKKMTINENRVYTKGKDGDPIKINN